MSIIKPWSNIRTSLSQAQINSHGLTLSTPCLVFLLGLNLTPEANEAGAAFTPKLNAFANNLTRWELTVEDVQVVPNMELFYSD